jgi:hypothetical protein
MMGEWGAEMIQDAMKYSGTLNVTRKGEAGTFAGFLELSYSKNGEPIHIREAATVTLDGHTATVACSDVEVLQGHADYNADNFFLTMEDQDTLAGDGRDARGHPSRVRFNRR